MEGLLIACEKPILNKQVHLFHCKTVPLGNNLIEQNQVVCKFPPCVPLMITVWSKMFSIGFNLKF